jgi:hypothetical protein
MPISRHHYNHNHSAPRQEYHTFIEELWDSFWNPPRIKCPKCQGVTVEYYDPFFFSPIRTLKGHRRVKCTTCHFIWRPSRRRKTLFKGFRPFM